MKKVSSQRQLTTGVVLEFRWRAIQPVAHHRVPQGGQVNANLVGAAGFNADLQQRELSEAHFQSPHATFRFGSPTPGSTFECVLVRRGFDVVPFSPCTSPMTYRNLPNSRYTFRVRAVSRDPAPCS